MRGGQIKLGELNIYARDADVVVVFKGKAHSIIERQRLLVVKPHADAFGGRQRARGCFIIRSDGRRFLRQLRGCDAG